MGLTDQPIADHRLNRIEPRIAAEDRDLVTILHAVIANKPEPLIYGVVIGYDHAGVSPDVEILQGMQRESGGDAIGAGSFSGELGKDALTGVLDDGNVVMRGDLHQPDHVDDLAGQLHRHDRPGFFGNRGLDVIDIHAERVVTIHQHRRRTGFGNRAYRRDKGIRGGDDFISMADAQRLERKLERVGSRAHPDGVAGADQFREAPLELGNRFAQGKIAGRDQPSDFGQDRGRVRELLEQIGLSHVVHVGHAEWSCEEAVPGAAKECWIESAMASGASPCFFSRLSCEP